ncbi:MAG: bifunctional oligoribonuclease/PAP phosphatase NrnA [Bacillota bacterium]
MKNVTVGDWRAIGLTGLLRRAESALIPLHVSPDGDSVGSALAAARACRHLGTRAVVVSSDPPPETYRFLAGWEDIRRPEEIEPGFDLLLLLDCSSLSRTGRVRDILDDRGLPLTVTIDHHRKGERVGDFVWADPGAAATAEMIFDWMSAEGLPIDDEVAAALYTGITTDTGFFAHSNTTAGTFDRAAALVRRGVRPDFIYRKINEDRPLREILILGRALEKLQTAGGGRVAWTVLTGEDMRQRGAGPDDTEGIINRLRSIAGTEIAILLVQTDARQVRVSFRSRERVDVSELAGEFGGGGHARAAGAKVSGEIEEVAARVVAAALDRLPPAEGD